MGTETSKPSDSHAYRHPQNTSQYRSYSPPRANPYRNPNYSNSSSNTTHDTGTSGVARSTSHIANSIVADEIVTSNTPTWPTSTATNAVLRSDTTSTSGIARTTWQTVHPARSESLQPSTAAPATSGVVKSSAAVLPSSRVGRPTTPTVHPANSGLPKHTAATIPGSGVSKPVVSTRPTYKVVKPTTTSIDPSRSEALQPSTAITAPATSEVSKPSIAVKPREALHSTTTSALASTCKSDVLERAPALKTVSSTSEQGRSSPSASGTGVDWPSNVPVTGKGTSGSTSKNLVTLDELKELLRITNTSLDIKEKAWKNEVSSESRNGLSEPEHKNEITGGTALNLNEDKFAVNSSNSQTSNENEGSLPTPSCPHHSLLDSLGDNSVHLVGYDEESLGRPLYPDLDMTSNEEARKSDSLQKPAASVSDPSSLDCIGDGRMRDHSPMGSESSVPSSAGEHRRPKNRNRNKQRKTQNNSEEKSDAPPKYSDVVEEMKAEAKKNDPPKHNFKNQFKGRKVFNERFQSNRIPEDRRPKTIDALNDLIKKEFGSVGEPTHSLPVVYHNEKMFSRKNCLYVGNLPFNIKREEVNELMAPYGEIIVDHHNVDKKFAFITLKHYQQAENAQRDLDGYVFKGRTLRVRRANRNICFKVMNLDPWVTNELLRKAFSAFGEVERAEIIMEDGKPIGEGLLEFSDRRSANDAFEACLKNCFLLTSSLRPIVLKGMNSEDCSRGFSESQINKNNTEYRKSREVGPRFTVKGTREHDCALLWKSFYERKRQEEEKLAKTFQQQERDLEKQTQSIMS